MPLVIWEQHCREEVHNEFVVVHAASHLHRHVDGTIVSGGGLLGRTTGVGCGRSLSHP